MDYEELVKKAEAKMVLVNDEKFVEDVAKLAHCLPSYFVGENGHIVEALKKLLNK